MPGIPPLRVTQPDSGFNQIPVFELELSGGTVSKLSPTKISLAIEGAQGPSGPSGASVVYAPTAGFYVVFSAMDVLTQERVIAGSDNISIVNSGTSFLISATTSDISGKQDTITYPLGINSGGTGLASVISATNLIGFNSSDTTKLDSYRLDAGDNIGLARTGTAFTISATTGAKTLLEASNATVNINSSGATYYVSANTSTGGSGPAYAPTGGPYITFVANDTLSAEKVLTASNNVTLTTDGNTVWIAATTNASTSTSGLVQDSRTITASSGLTGGGDLTADREFSVNTNIRDKSFAMFAAGNISTDMFSEGSRIYIPYNMELVRVDLAAPTGPTGQALIVDVNQYNNTIASGTSLFTAANRPQIADGSNVGSSNTFAIPTLHAGSYLGFDIDQVGSTNAGSNLTITLITRTS